MEHTPQVGSRLEGPETIKEAAAPEVPRGIELTRAVAERIESQIGKLESKLSPVLAVGPEGKSDVPSEPWGTEYGSALGRTHGILTIIEERLSSILSRLEV